ncbi:DNA mismatch repair protein MutS [soil metagenome]
MLRQYFAVKAEHPGVLLAMRVGDFYEFYGEDAEIAANALEITLTGREDGSNGRIPMAGVPFHSVEKYLARLVAKGIKVALGDQLEDPKAAKGLVRRGVTRVLTPGTLMEDAMLSAERNAFLAAICLCNGQLGLAVLDPSTGEFAVTELPEASGDALVQELARLRPTEILLGPCAETYGEMAKTSLGSAITELDILSPDRANRKLQEHFRVANLSGFGCDDKPSAVTAAAMVLAYAEKNHLALGHVDSLRAYSVDGFMRLDPSTRRSLELTQNLADGGRRFTLLSVLDATMAPMGARCLRRWIDQPLLDRETIEGRLDAVERLVDQPMVRADIRDALKKMSDLERLVSRCAAGLAGPRDLSALRASLQALPDLDRPLLRVGVGKLQEIREAVGDHGDTARALAKALVDDPPATLREGGIIREGHDLELDKLRDLNKGGKSYIAGLEARERERSGISGLKVGFNSVFGYYLEVSKLHSAKVPADYVRKQTTANAERYITAELKDQEAQVLGAEEKAVALEGDLFICLRLMVASRARPLLETARALAELDALASLAETAVRKGYVRPELVEEDALDIEAGRHPVVEAAMNGFVPNDTNLNDGARLIVLTGPNMAGKSTYLRQIALIQLMAQIGSFVPAKRARLGLADRIFARIGAKDELALGQSTFMVEMVESANILNHANARSLVILDEVGRGTSTYDGMAIAQAMVESLASIGAKTLFATHYHQLNALAGEIGGIANFRVAVEEVADEVVWTHRVVPGGADRSYGIHVARMAGVPAPVLRRATDILRDLERTEPPKPALTQKKLQLSLFEAEEPPIVGALRDLDVDRLTPMEALRTLDDFKRRYTG